jgi:heme-degrading monooxygenase HmoA
MIHCGSPRGDPCPVRRKAGEEDEGMSVVKINVLTVPAEQREILEKRFASRAHAVENSDGFEWFELLRPAEGTDKYLVYTRWRDEAAFEAWRDGPMRSAHRDGGPAEGGERPKPAATDATLWSFEVVQQAGPDSVDA